MKTYKHEKTSSEGAPSSSSVNKESFWDDYKVKSDHGLIIPSNVTEKCIDKRIQDVEKKINEDQKGDKTLPIEKQIVNEYKAAKDKADKDAKAAAIKKSEADAVLAKTKKDSDDADVKNEKAQTLKFQSYQEYKKVVIKALDA